MFDTRPAKPSTTDTLPQWPRAWESHVSTILPQLEQLGVRKEFSMELKTLFAWLLSQDETVKKKFDTVTEALGIKAHFARRLEQSNTPASIEEDLQLFGRITHTALVFQGDPLLLEPADKLGKTLEHYRRERALEKYTFPMNSASARMLASIVNDESFSTAELGIVTGMLSDYVSRTLPRGLLARVAGFLGGTHRGVPAHLRKTMGPDLDANEFRFLREMSAAAVSHMQAEEALRQSAEAKAREEGLALESRHTMSLELEKSTADSQRLLIEAKQRLLDTATNYVELTQGHTPSPVSFPRVDEIVNSLDVKNLPVFGTAHARASGHVVEFKRLSLPNWNYSDMTTRDAAFNIKDMTRYKMARQKWKDRLALIEHEGIFIDIPQEVGFQIMRLPEAHPIRSRCEQTPERSFRINIEPYNLSVEENAWRESVLVFRRGWDRLGDRCRVSYDVFVPERYSRTDLSDSEIESLACAIIIHAAELYNGEPCPRVP